MEQELVQLGTEVIDESKRLSNTQHGFRAGISKEQEALSMNTRFIEFLNISCSLVNDNVLTDDALRLYLMKVKRLLVMLMLVPRLKVLPIKNLAKLVEIFVELVLLYGYSTAVYRMVDDSKLKALPNTALRMMLSS
ncbi:hypothetical protein ACTXT7_005883 [Hymenolepis weldensis]